MDNAKFLLKSKGLVDVKFKDRVFYINGDPVLKFCNSDIDDNVRAQEFFDIAILLIHAVYKHVLESKDWTVTDEGALELSQEIIIRMEECLLGEFKAWRKKEFQKDFADSTKCMEEKYKV